MSSQPEEATLLDQSPRGLGGEQKVQSRGKHEGVSSSSLSAAGGTVPVGEEDGSRSEDQGLYDQLLFQMLW